MTSKLGQKSANKLATCHNAIQQIVLHTIIYINSNQHRLKYIKDITIIWGHRNEEEQNKEVAEGDSQLLYPDSSHNSIPSNAADIAPYPTDWNNYRAFAELRQIIEKIAFSLSIDIKPLLVFRNGGVDWPHVELVEV